MTRAINAAERPARIHVRADLTAFQTTELQYANATSAERGLDCR